MVEKALSVHEAAKLFPSMTQDEFEGLKADIKQFGQTEPICVQNGFLIDGRHRLRACHELGIKPRFYELPQSESAVHYVMSRNLHRRNLNPSQRAMIGQSLVSMLSQEAKQRHAALSGKPSVTKPRENLPQVTNGRARDKAGEAVGVSGKLIDAADKVVKQGVPELAEAVKRGAVKVTAAATVASLPKSEQAAVVAKGDAAIKKKASEVREEKKKPEAKPNVKSNPVVSRPGMMVESVLKEQDAIETIKALWENAPPDYQAKMLDAMIGMAGLKVVQRRVKDLVAEERLRAGYDPANEEFSKSLREFPKFIETWKDWCEYRKSKRKKITEKAAALQVKFLEEIGPEAGIVSIEDSIRNDYTGLFPPKSLKGKPFVPQASAVASASKAKPVECEALRRARAIKESVEREDAEWEAQKKLKAGV